VLITKFLQSLSGSSYLGSTPNETTSARSNLLQVPIAFFFSPKKNILHGMGLVTIAGTAQASGSYEIDKNPKGRTILASKEDLDGVRVN